MSESDLLNEEEAANYLGVLPRTLREWRTKRGLPHYKPTAKVVIYKRGELIAWLERKRTVKGA